MYALLIDIFEELISMEERTRQAQGNGQEWRAPFDGLLLRGECMFGKEIKEPWLYVGGHLGRR